MIYQESLAKIFIEDPPSMTPSTSKDIEIEWIEAHRKSLRYSKEVSPFFQKVIVDIVSSNRSTGGAKRDIILQAPCGSGKSTCFVLASMELGGITVSCFCFFFVVIFVSLIVIDSFL
jgi:superfamily II DNA or RNA helicase